MANAISNLKLNIRDFFTRGHSRTVNARKNILIMLFIRGCSIAIGFIMVPLTIGYINPTRYGIWLTMSSIISWFSFFDIGFGNGLRNRFAEAVAQGKDDLARIYVSTTYAILGLIIIIVLIVFVLINPLLNWARILNTPETMINELRVLALIVFVFFCIQFVLRLITTVLNANQQPAKASLFDFFGSLFSLAVIYTLTRTTSGNLVYLGTAFSLTPALVLLLSSIWFYTHEYRKYAPSLKLVRFPYARNLMTLGLKFFFIQIAAVILYQTSNIIIAQLFGPEQVTPYNVAHKYFSVIPMGLGIIMMPFWSAYTEAWVKKDISWIKSTVRKLQLLILIAAAGVLIMLAFSDFIYRIWVGEKIKVPFSLSAVIALYVIINGWGSIYSFFLNGVGKIKLQLYFSFFGALINIPLALFLGKHVGISGVILATCIIGFMSAVWSPIQYYKIINNKAKGIWNK
jgi:O-antigen/teichoic acid export membrane protein